MSAGLEIVPLPDRDDGRGAAFHFDAETLRWLAGVADVHVVEIAPGKVRGNHRHRARREVAFVRHRGAVEVAWQAPGGGPIERRTFEGHGGFLARIESGTLHAFRNSGAGRVEVVSMSNGRFDHAETEYATLLTEARA